MISRLHYITQDLSEISHQEQVKRACEGGADWVQLRVKEKPVNDIETIALEAQKICKKFGAKLIINDHIQIAKSIQADGVHIGKEDTPPQEARDYLGDNYIIGCTANTLEDVLRLQALKIDYIGLGPFRFTSTKKNLSPVIGIEGYKVILAHDIKLPIIGIGGIKTEDIPSLLNAGLHGIAVSSLINLAENPSEKTKEIISTLENNIHA
ncbi:thiamine phosphate synthase [Aureibacter tunicatorum]|uniref:Thiamine-phosphate synthase n=1 Tax=Aureibacter tunicatorum TaxID=866807 RepID=A0AAE4BVB5_9BACT|nr:thiamine phosphate synthase [Aureibacter tunicatorum]MDR6241722.1 thiamine-phosphate pyrophosphorylase [Aureibacter tunicatorum]BDD07293.1 thiamine-phosphate synthase [Aureibacter tunicatorum]